MKTRIQLRPVLRISPRLMLLLQRPAIIRQPCLQMKKSKTGWRNFVLKYHQIQPKPLAKQKLPARTLVIRRQRHRDR
jgi:hypothetical protein